MNAVDIASRALAAFFAQVHEPRRGTCKRTTVRPGPRWVKVDDWLKLLEEESLREWRAHAFFLSFLDVFPGSGKCCFKRPCWCAVGVPMAGLSPLRHGRTAS
jgi:hypothetical protein